MLSVVYTVTDLAWQRVDIDHPPAVVPPLAACSAAVLTGEQNRSDTPHRWWLQARHLTLLWCSSDEYRHVKLFNFHTRKVNEFIFALNLLWSLRFLSYILILLRNSKSCILYSILSTVIQYLRTLLISILRTVDSYWNAILFALKRSQWKGRPYRKYHTEYWILFTSVQFDQFFLQLPSPLLHSLGQKRK